ncbi:MAG: hypothetical protein KJO82_09030 [Gammaproteobacteria bacterium]|nr:hypothetical protein [Gammaproteobacteria bacterium]
MKIGHVSLGTAASGRDDRFFDSVKALSDVDINQHVLVSNVVLARRLAELKGVSVGPIVKTPVMAYCLMPNVDLAHIHELQSGQAGLLLTLTRSIPFVLTTGSENEATLNPLTRSVLHRAIKIIPRDDESSARELANAYLMSYEEAVNTWYRAALKIQS